MVFVKNKNAKAGDGFVFFQDFCPVLNDILGGEFPDLKVRRRETKWQISGSISEKCPVTGLKASQLPLKNFPPFEKRKLREHCSKSCLVMCPYMFCQVGSQALFKERVSAILWRGMLLLLNKVYARPAYRSLHETLDKQMIGRNDSHQHLEEEILRWWYFNQASIFLARVSVLHESQIWNLAINKKICDFVVKTFLSFETNLYGRSRPDNASYRVRGQKQKFFYEQ